MQSGKDAVQQRSSVTKVATASLIGTTIEWYDFFIFGTASALVFGKLFFPQFSELAGTLAAFASFAVGFVARPLGGLVFGHFGDRIGRKAMLVVTITMMGAATFLMGLMPTYATIGIAAPIAMAVLRFTQGLAVGGEWGGAVLMATEHAGKKRRGFFGSFAQVGSASGGLLSTGMFVALQRLPEDDFLSWAGGCRSSSASPWWRSACSSACASWSRRSSPRSRRPAARSRSPWWSCSAAT
ncbi:MAG: MFS transporter [Streptosporangiales bacterium]|nr:MFS transporter [Streptosporangiales bacterium]